MRNRNQAQVETYKILEESFIPSNATWQYTDPFDLRSWNSVYAYARKTLAEPGKVARICMQWAPTKDGPWIDETKKDAPTKSGTEMQSDIYIDVANLSLTSTDPDFQAPFNRGFGFGRVGFRGDATTGKIEIGIQRSQE